MSPPPLDLLALFAFAHNEERILNEWLLYHGAIAGYHNLHVVDNCSTDNTGAILRDFARRGVNIYTHPDYGTRAEFLSGLMHAQKDRVRFLIPLDIDEFVAVRQRRDGRRIFGTSATSIRTIFQSLAPTDHMYQFSHTLHSIETQASYRSPVMEIQSFFETSSEQWNKVFFRSSSFVSVAGGNHGGRVTSQSDFKEHTRFCLFHFHYLGYDETYRRALRLCALRGYDVTDAARIKDMVEKQVPGRHRLRYILRYREMQREREMGAPLDIGKIVVESDDIRKALTEIVTTMVGSS